ncbi:DUF4132 domain-containing protein [Catenulispora rubra]|uniref:DUF4132 domain-containing protein n=1 Tax=Catenulispora rubra TaxID=280293 RepID=UPI0018920CD7|nr:DUF4132 domain-containing protein [Catenulispora rubra]
MTVTVDEEFVLPERFRAKVLRRRGDGGVPTPIDEPLSSLVEWMDSLRQEADRFYQHAIADPGSERDLVEAATQPGFDTLTTASPLQAGLRVALIFGAAKSVVPRRFVDSWVLGRGHAFAVCAVAELHGVCAISPDYLHGRPQNPQFLRGPEPHERDFRWRVAARLLALLADATDAEYADAAAAATEYRDGSRDQRALTSFLFRERTEWVDADLRAAEVLDGRRDVDLACCLLAAALTTSDQAREYVARQPWLYWPKPEETLPTVLASVGPAVAPLLVPWLDEEWLVDGELLALFSELGSEESIRALITRLGAKGVQGSLLAGGKLFPRRTLRVLAETDLGPGEVVWAKHVTHALALHANAYPELAREELPTLSPDARARVEAALDPPRALPDAPSATLPKVLVAPPWVNRDTAAAPVVVKGLTAPAGAFAAWADGEREEWLATWFRDQRHPTEPDDAVIAAFLADQGDYRSDWRQIDGVWRQINYARFFCRAADELVRPLLEAGGQPRARERDGWARVYLARFEVLGLPMALKAAASHRLGLIQPFRSPEIAAAFAVALTQRTTGRADAVRWLTRHADYAAEQLIPAAVGKPGKDRQAAARTVRWLGDKAGVHVIAIAAETYGDEAAAAIRILMESDGGEELPKTLPEAPRWAESFSLPQIALADGASGLPSEAVRHLGQMLALSKPSDPYDGIATVKELCDAVSLREYAWALMENWRMAGYPSECAWVLLALCWFGDDEIVRRLDPLIRAWPGENGHARAVKALDVFAAIGTDLALTTLSGISQRLKFKALKDRAGEKIAEIAEGLGLTAEQLADRVVPDLGLDANGAMTLDFGPRRFAVGFDAELKPCVREESGKHLKALPKPGANDDSELAEAAVRDFSALKKRARTVVADQVARLERAMVLRRRWDAAEFSAFFVRHPLVRHIARQVVWGTFDARGVLVATFRVAEDLTFADLDDELFTVPDDAVIGVAHPLDLGDLVGRWSDVLADYQILQPFAQLGRQPHVLTDAERASLVLNRFDDIGMPAGKVAGLTRRGWVRGEPWDSGIEVYIARPLPDGRVLFATLDPGIAVGNIAESEDQTFEGVWISRDGSGYCLPVPERSDPFGTLDPVTASEILRDLTEVTAQ